jgi:hypothetical protein
MQEEIKKAKPYPKECTQSHLNTTIFYGSVTASYYYIPYSTVSHFVRMVSGLSTGGLNKLVMPFSNRFHPTWY